MLELAESPDLDIETLDALGELRDELARQGIELRLAQVRAPALALLGRAGLKGRIRIAPSLDAAADAAAVAAAIAAANGSELDQDHDQQQ